MKKKISNDEIDLSNIILSLWDNKFKILLITTASIIIGFFYYNFLDKRFSALTNIKPISTFEYQKYVLYNSLAEEASTDGETSIVVNSKNLLNLFINKIQTTEIIQEAIDETNLINKDNFASEENYNDAVKRIAILINDKMTAPSKNKKNYLPYWQYNFIVSDKLIWRNFLEYVEKKANEETRQFLINQFNTNSDILSNQTKFKLEEINQNIVNAFDDYKTYISNRLAFLNEQAEIARTLNIAKNTLEVENFQPDNRFIANIKSEDSYYLKGYEMIEKEISIINSRKNVEPFVKNLIKLKKIKRSIVQNNKVERLKTLFSETPVYNKSEFVAARIDYITTVYNSNNQSLERTLGISLIIGLVISFMYIFLINAIGSRK